MLQFCLSGKKLFAVELPVMILLMPMLMIMPITTQAQMESPATMHYSIPPGSLEKALNQFASQAGIAISMDADQVKNLSTAGLEGAYNVESGLSALLKNSDFTFEKNSAGYVVVQKATTRGSSDSSTQVLPEIKVTSNDEQNSLKKTYIVPTTASATKTNTPIMQTPVSIQVIPEVVMRDQQAFRLQDVVKNVSGVQQRFSTGGIDHFVVRGFDLGEVQYRNGIRIEGLNFDIANAAQVDVVKDPASVMYGRIEPGGMINVMTKRPSAQRVFSVEQRFGSYGHYRTHVSATGQVTKDGSLLYGLDLSYLNTGSFRDFGFNDRVFVAPSLTWRPLHRTELNFTLEYLHENRPYDSGIPAFGNRVANVPISRQYDQPGLHDKRENVLLDFNWSHHFNDAWRLQNGVVYYSRNQTYNELYSASVSDRTIGRETWFGKANNTMHTVYVNLTGNFVTRGIKHNVLVGGEYYSVTNKEPGTRVYAVDTIDIFNPVHPVIDPNAIRSLQPNIKFANNQSWFGVYFQNQITLWDKLHIMGGGRYDWARVSSGYDDPAVFQLDKIRDARFNPRAGVLYQPVSWLSLYGNWVESFGSSNGRSPTGDPFKPQTASQFEGGIKTELMDKRLMASVAYFHLTKSNLVTTDPSNVQFNIAVGEARSQGVEVDIPGQIAKGLNLIRTYAYTDTEIIKDFSGIQGNRLPYVPLHSGSVWLKYDFQQESLRGLSIGGGVYAAGKRFGNVTNSYYDDGYARLDLYAAYRHKLGRTNLTAQINANNVTGSEYFILRSQANNLPAEPLVILGSVRLDY